MSAERRVQPRRPQAFRVRAEGPRGTQYLTGRDVSEAGFFVESPKPFDPGQQLRCRLELPDGDPVEVLAEVRHRTNDYRTDDGQGPYRGMGLRILRMGAEDQARLLAFLASG